ncbi:MAG TPA: zf-HC2 domain-containing protein [Candidatus Kapabacteria bacterium]|nr:zf-HC2 domain-containing protein [Candidatus Kapabacteria bacterium]
MICADYQERASALLDGVSLSSAERDDLADHLQSCAPCDLDHSLDKATRNVLKLRFPLVETPVTVRESIQQFISQQLAI